MAQFLTLSVCIFNFLHPSTDLRLSGFVTALDAGDEDDDCDDDGGDDGRRGRDDDPVELLGALAGALGPDLATLLVGDVPGGDLQLLQGDHADDDALLPEVRFGVKLSQLETDFPTHLLHVLETGYKEAVCPRGNYFLCGFT